MVNSSTAGRRRWRLTVTQQILIGLVAGVAVGWLWPGLGVSLRPLAQLFLRLIKMIVGPLIFTTLVAGVAGAGGKMVGRLGLKAILWFEAATTVALLVGLCAANLIVPGTGVAMAEQSATLQTLAHEKGAMEFILDAFPTSIFDAMARNDVLQVVVFSIFLGLGISAGGPKTAPLKELAEAGAEAVFKVVGIIMRFAPVGVAAAMAATLGANGMSVLWPLLKAVATLYIALVAFLALLFTAMKLTTGASLRVFLGALREPAVLAFTTSTSEAAMPRAMQILEDLGVPRSVVAFVVPTGYSFNLDGSALYLSVALMFVAQAAGVHLTLGQQLAAMGMLMLTSKGVAGVPRSALVVLAGALAAFHLPLEGVAILLGIDALMDMGRTAVNVIGNCVAAVVVARWEGVLAADGPLFAGTRKPASKLPAPQPPIAAVANSMERSEY